MAREEFSSIAAPRRVLFLSSEAYPLAKTGGLADVSGALPESLAGLGVDVRVMIPGYPQALDVAIDKRVVADLSLLIGEPGSRLIAGRIPQSGLPVLLFDCPRLFQRSGSLYQDQEGRDWGDNDRRFAVFCRAAAQVALDRVGLGWHPDIVHANDWHTGILPGLLRFAGAPRPRTVFTIHNLAFQGNFPLDSFPALGLPDEAMSANGVEFYGQVSFLKAGIRYADRLTTVSPTYAQEILTPEHGCGLDGLLRSRATDLVGILNGVDYGIWDPAQDAELNTRYSPEAMAGKDACKAALREEIGLEPETRAPLLIYVNRLTHQKMADVMLEAVPRLVANGYQLAVHGEGDPDFAAGFSALAQRYPGQVAVRIGYQEPLAHRLHAGGDLSLTPSRFEPCGLTTMYALRYGAIPVTRPVGGLADTVQDADEHAAREHDGNGFVFEPATANELDGCVQRAAAWYERPAEWKQLQRRAMQRDFAWERSAGRYIEIYDELLTAGRPRPTPARAAPRDSAALETAALETAVAS